MEGAAGPIPLPTPETYALELNETMQTVATILLWGGTLLLLAYAAKIAREVKNPLPVLIVLAVAAGSIIEPIYDITYHLHWLGADASGDGVQWTLFTAFGLPQPVWVMPAYVIVFALPAVLLYRTFAAGVTMKAIFGWAGLTVATTTLFETIAVNVDLYTYYGEAPVRVLNYPIWIGFMEAAQITGFAVLCAIIALRATRTAHYFVVFLVFPANFAFETLGAGFPTLIAQNVPDPSMALMTAMVPISIALAATGLWWTAQLLFYIQRLREQAGIEAPTAPTMSARAKAGAVL
ncbi:MAG: hypothetical protein ACT4PP_13500 [Sporichthyaceae bacterium]